MKKETNMSLQIYTDGACKGNPGKGGWAFCIYDFENKHIKSLNGGESNTTNNRMELMALLQAFEYMSEYVVYSFQYDDDDKESKFRRVTPFMFDSQSADAESTFEVYFTLPLDSSGKVYNYGFSLNKNEILEEWLNSKAKSAKKYSTIFQYPSFHQYPVAALPVSLLAYPFLLPGIMILRCHNSLTC